MNAEYFSDPAQRLCIPQSVDLGPDHGITAGHLAKVGQTFHLGFLDAVGPVAQHTQTRGSRVGIHLNGAGWRPGRVSPAMQWTGNAGGATHDGRPPLITRPLGWMTFGAV